MNDDATDWLFRTTPLRKSYRDDESGDRSGDGDGSPAPITGHAVGFGELRLPRGGVIALIGASGTGKTTLFNLLAGLDEPDRPAHGDAPRILLNPGGGPVDICARPQGFVRARVGFIFQAGFLVKNATAGLNLSLPLAQSGLRADRAELAERLATLGIEDAAELDRRAWQFSGGEAQRIAFVRSIAHDPELIFADEPTSNVDFENAVRIMGQLRAWVHDPAHPGRTLLWITHDIRLAAAIADAVLVLYRGDLSPLSPLRLPGEPKGGAGRDREREMVLERWTYSREALLADDPPEWRGTGSAPGPAAVGAATGPVTGRAD